MTKRKQRLSWFLVKPDVDIEDPDAIVDPPAKGTLHRYKVSALNKEHDSTLSHLFAHGVTSAGLLLSDEDFRREAAKKVSEVDGNFKSAVPKKLGERGKIKVAYVVLSRGQRPDKPYGLPFFSLVSMKAAVERLRRSDVEVWAKEIKEAS